MMGLSTVSFEQLRSSIWTREAVMVAMAADKHAIEQWEAGKRNMIALPEGEEE